MEAVSYTAAWIKLLPRNNKVHKHQLTQLPHVGTTNTPTQVPKLAANQNENNIIDGRGEASHNYNPRSRPPPTSDWVEGATQLM